MRQTAAMAACLVLVACAAAPAWGQSTAGLKDLKAFTQEQVDKDHGRATGSVEAELEDGTKFFGDVVDWWNDTHRVLALGNVLFVQGENRIAADRAELDTQTGLGTFFNASGSLSIADRVNRDMFGSQDPDVYFYGEKVERLGPKKYRITKGGFTTCLQPTPRWQLTSGSAVLNIDAYAVATNTLLKVKGVPVLYLPIIYYPIKKDDRATGFLMPSYGNSSMNGFTLSNAFFWAVSRSVDATVQHDWFSRGGQGVGGEFRYIGGTGSDGNARVRYLNEKERTYGTILTPARRSFDVNGAVSQVLPGRLRARFNANYFSDITVQQTYNMNMYDASRRTRGFGGNLSGAWGLYNFNAMAGWNEIFLSDTDTWKTGSAPRVSFGRGLQRLGPLPVFVSAGTEFTRSIHTNKSGDQVNDAGLMRMDFAPQARLPFRKWQFFTVDSSVTWRSTYYSESKQNGIQVPVSIWRNFAQVDSRITGPVFTRVWVTDGLGYADRFKHVFEPNATISRVSAIDNYDSIVKIDGSDYAVGGTTRISYGLTNRLIARRREAGRVSPREILTISVGQSYYTKKAASQVDTSYSTSFAGRAPSNFSVVRGDVRISPTPAVGGTVRLEWDPEIRAFQSKSVSGDAAAGRWLHVAGGWSQRRVRAYQFQLDNYVNGELTLRTPENKVGGTYSATYDVSGKNFLQSRMVAYYNAQCCGVAVEYQTFNYPNARNRFPLAQDRRFNISVTLAGLGTFSNLFGGLGGGGTTR